MARLLRVRRRLLAGLLASLNAGLGVGLAFGPGAPALAADTALAQLRAFIAATASARGAFTQRTARSGGGVETVSGVFAFQRPGRFRWEVRKPYDQLLVADGEKLHFLDRDLNQVTVRRLGDAVGASPAALLFGGQELDRAFTFSESGAREGLDWVLAVPRSREAGFDRILIGLRAGQPEQMEVRDAFGRTTVFAFSALERNPRLEADLFRFTAPRGADVVEQ
jgi:outer membrane lipoprotein carrier protein